MTGRVLSRRSALAGLTAGAAAVAGGICAEDLLGGSGPRPVAAMLDDLAGSYDFNQGWLFGGPYVKGAESPFRAADAYGNHQPGVTGDVALSVRGPAVLIGSNPFPFGESGGVGGAFLRSVPGTTGTVTVTARHPSLGEAAVAVRVSRAYAGTA